MGEIPRDIKKFDPQPIDTILDISLYIAPVRPFTEVSWTIPGR